MDRRAGWDVGFGAVVNEVGVEGSEPWKAGRTVGLSKQASRPDAKGVVLEPGASRPPQDAELWSVGHKLGPHPPQAWNGMSRQEKTESQPGFWSLMCLWAVLDPATRGSARITMLLSC